MSPETKADRVYPAKQTYSRPFRRRLHRESIVNGKSASAAVETDKKIKYFTDRESKR